MNDEWFNKQFMHFPPPPYCSVDLRNSGYKIAPVDTNLFPAGFNNLHHKNISHAVKAAEKLAKHYVKNCRRVLIVPENHTRNIFYFESLAILQSIFEQAGFEVRVGSLLPEITRPHEIELPSGKKLVLMPLIRKDNLILSEDFCACLILLNHDLSEGTPEILKDIAQKIAPPINLGWWSRKKSDHFSIYQEVVEDYAKYFNIDPWLMRADFDVGKNINFETGEGEEDLIQKTSKLLERIEKKYREYQVKDTPYVVIKADSGTYGMGILMVKSPDDLRNLNRKDRSRMVATKGNQKINQVIIQEGVYSKDTWSHAVAEPVIYMIEEDVVGGFYRVNANKKSDENLNSPGMHFEPVDIFNCEAFQQYKTIARLALLAAAKEL